MYTNEDAVSRPLQCGPVPGPRQQWALCAALALCLSAAAAHAGPAHTGPAQTAGQCPDPLPPGATTVHATVTGAHSVAGNITFSLYGADPALFLAHHGTIANVRIPLTGSSATACFEVSGPGIYGFAVYHDENDNHHFDRTLVGLPAEGYGFSNDAPALLGLPAFSNVRFKAGAGDTALTIKLRYP